MVGNLAKSTGAFGGSDVLLAGVVSVVEAHTDDLAWGGDRRTDLYL